MEITWIVVNAKHALQAIFASSSVESFGDEFCVNEML